MSEPAPSSNADVWSPEGFDSYAARFPATPPLSPPPELATTQAFVERWKQGVDTAEVARLLEDTTVVFVRGFLADYMPGNLAAPTKALRQAGVDVHLVKSSASATASENVDALAAVLERRAHPRLVFCGHSRGGIESLLLLARRPDLAQRCAGVLLSQSSRGGSRVMESLLLKQHQQSLTRLHRRSAEAVQRLGLRLIGATRGGQELTGERLATLLAEVDAAPRAFPVIQTASWSTRPTAWLDSFHERLGEIQPGCAHDGQFYLMDLIWPGLPHVLLPQVDHAQPAMGGYGFDHVRYWFVLLSLLLEPPPSPEGPR